MHRIDKAINNDTLVVCKCLIPYLDSDMQRNMAILIKGFELLYTIKLFSSEEFIRSISVERKDGWHHHLLQDVKKNINPDRAYMIDMALKFSEFQKIMATKQAIPPVKNEGESVVAQKQPLPPAFTREEASPSPSDVIDQFSSVLEPNQLQLLKMLSTLMNTH